MIRNTYKVFWNKSDTCDIIMQIVSRNSLNLQHPETLTPMNNFQNHRRTNLEPGISQCYFNCWTHFVQIFNTCKSLLASCNLWRRHSNSLGQTCHKSQYRFSAMHRNMFQKEYWNLIVGVHICINRRYSALPKWS